MKGNNPKPTAHHNLQFFHLSARHFSIAKCHVRLSGQLKVRGSESGPRHLLKLKRRRHMLHFMLRLLLVLGKGAFRETLQGNGHVH